MALQSIIPPSVHATGRRYEWLPGLSPEEVEVSPMPFKLWDFCHWVATLRADDHSEVDEDGRLYLPEGTRHDYMVSKARELREWGLGRDQLRNMVEALDAEVVHFDDTVRRGRQLDSIVDWVCDNRQPKKQEESRKSNWQLTSVWDAVKKPKPQRESVVEGVVRCGEVMNIVAATKAGKSWFALSLAFAVATGMPWLGQRTRKGRVLLLDNELYDDTIENRCAAVAKQMKLDSDPDDFDYVELRGKNVGIDDVCEELETRFAPAELTMVLLDAKYRFFSNGMQENSNDDQTTFHNLVDQLARKLKCVVVLVHHATKGDQAGKAVTDIGAGGGSQSRTVDCHMTIVPHAEGDELFVLDGKVRTFSGDAFPKTLRWDWPVWKLEEGIEPVKQQRVSGNDRRRQEAVQDKVEAILAMLLRGSQQTASENKLSGGHPAQPTFRKAIAVLEADGKIVWVEDYRAPRSSKVTGGWRLKGSGAVNSGGQ